MAVSNVELRVDSRQAVNALRQAQQGAQSTSQAVDKLNAATTATNDKFKIAANGIKYFTDAAGRARAENGRFLTTAERAAAGIQAQGAAAQQAAGKLAGFGNALGGLRGALVSVGAGALVVGMVRGAAAAEQLQLRLKLLSREYGETERVQQFVAQSAKTFGQSQIEASAGVADVYARLRPLGTSLAQIETVYKGFNAVALASGTSAEAASGAFLQLSQALGSGRLQGDEFRSVAEQVPGILKLVADEMGVTVGQLKQLGSDGKITSDVLINALAKGFEENKNKIGELLALSPAQRFKEFKDSTQELSNALGSELLPAIVPIVKDATALLRLFGQLPGPIKTIIAAAIGLTAAFVALAPAITAIIGLLGGLSLATLAAAGPWIALAAGVTAAAVALAGYRTESQKIGGAAAGGGAADLAAARNAMVQKQQTISSLEQRRKTSKGRERASIDIKLASERKSFADLKAGVSRGQQVEISAATSAPSAIGTVPTGGTRGGGSSATKAANDAKRTAEQIQQQLKEADDLNVTLRDRLAITQTTEPIAKRMLEYDIKRNEIARNYDELKKAAKTADERTLIDANFILENSIAQVEYEQQMNDLQNDRLNALHEIMNSVDEIATKTRALTAAEKQQLDLAESLSTTFGQGLTGAFDALISGSDNWGKSLQDIASGVLIDIANQLLRIFVIEQAISAIKGILSPAGPSAGGYGALPGFNSIAAFRANGGSVTAGKPYMVGERGPELFMPGRSGGIAPANSFGGGVNVVVNVDATGSNVQGDQSQAKQLGGVISAAVQAELVKQKRPGGLLA